jgi:hypothetical protein
MVTAIPTREEAEADDVTNVCVSCADGDLTDIDWNYREVVVTDPQSKRPLYTGPMCEAHVEMYLEDGYRVDIGKAVDRVTALQRQASDALIERRIDEARERER